MIERIRSGGQTGVDRAALDVARELGIPCAGWCPRGRRAEDGVIGPVYPLQETPSSDYSQRSDWNVRDADATLILFCGTVHGGTAYTLERALAQSKPVLCVDLLLRPPALSAALAWLEKERVGQLNIAGPRESTDPGVYRRASLFLRALLSRPGLPGPSTSP